MLSCKDATRLISQSMDRSLPLGKRIGVRFHLLICRFCARYARQLRLLRESARYFALPEAELPGRSGEILSPEARARIRNSLSLP
jgi:hypothetical protein